MNHIPQWSGEVLESNQYFWNHPAKPTFDPARPPHGPHVNGMMGSFKNIEKISQQIGQMFVQTSQPIASEDMQQHAKPSLTSETLIVQSMDLRGNKTKYKGKNNVNPYQTPKILIVQSMELRGNNKKYKCKHNVNPSQTPEIVIVQSMELTRNKNKYKSK